MKINRYSPKQQDALRQRELWDFSAIANADREVQRDRAVSEYLGEVERPRDMETKTQRTAPFVAVHGSRQEHTPSWFFAPIRHGEKVPERFTSRLLRYLSISPDRSAEGAPESLKSEFIRLLAINLDDVPTKQVARRIAREVSRKLRTELESEIGRRPKKPRVDSGGDPFGDPMGCLWNLSCYRLKRHFRLGRKEATDLLELTEINKKRPNLLKSCRGSSADVLFSRSHTAAKALIAAPHLIFQAERQRIFREMLNELNRQRVKNLRREK